MKAPRAVLFLGDRSRYGLVHLHPLLESFDVAALVVATPARWETFAASLNGRTHVRPPLRARTVLGAKVAARRLLGRDERAAARRALRGLGIPLIEADDANDPALLARLRELAPELLVSAAYPQIFGEALLSVASRGAVNFHPSVLPRCRGAHPHFWAIATGEAEGGVSAHFMTPQLDQGDLIAQIRFPMEGMYYGELYRRIERETPELVARVRAFFDDPAARPAPQDGAAATTFRNDRAIHRRIFWTLHSGEQVHRLVRTEQAYCFLGRRRVGVLHADLAPTNRNLTNAVAVEPGTVVDLTPRHVVVKTVDACLEIDTFAAGGALPAAEFARRARLAVGERFL